jgi:hypothetical protein
MVTRRIRTVGGAVVNGLKALLPIAVLGAISFGPRNGISASLADPLRSAARRDRERGDHQHLRRDVEAIVDGDGATAGLKNILRSAPCKWSKGEPSCQTRYKKV